MTYGFDLGRLKNTSTGMSYVDFFYYTTGTVNKTYDSPAFAFATDVKHFIMPAEDIPADKIPVFPTVSTSLSTANKRITLSVTGGNVNVNILVFVR
ncbi:MAG: hypothetical protein ACK42H_19305 [Planctomycetota bacterium]|jgi:hypothetical protein